MLPKLYGEAFGSYPKDCSSSLHGSTNCQIRTINTCMKRVLFVDDDKEDWYILVSKLSEKNIEIHWQMSLHIAKPMLAIIDHDYFDLLLIDYRGTTFPNFDLMKELDALHSGLKSKIVITSGVITPSPIMLYPFIKKDQLAEFLIKRFE